MLEPAAFLSCLLEHDIDFFTGVPDSLLKEFLLVVQSRLSPEQHFICANEGAAIALAAGYQMGTGKIPMVYMQNSGLGNAVNPLMSLCHGRVYSIPMLLLIGWRGQPGVADEPQHLAMGAITADILKTAGVACFELDANDSGHSAVGEAVKLIQSSGTPVAILCKKGAFAASGLRSVSQNDYPMSRRQAIETVLLQLNGKEIIVCTTGFASRELHELRQRSSQAGGCDFLNVGAMGHASQIAIGLALAQPSRQVICLDGDGALIMHMGGLTTIGKSAAKNYKHIVLNNGVHDSVGGQATGAFGMDIAALALACGYRSAATCVKQDEFAGELGAFLHKDGPALIEVRINTAGSEQLSRPGVDLLNRKQEFLEFIL